MEKRLKAYDVVQLRAKLREAIVTPFWVRYMEAFLADVAQKSGGGYGNVSLNDPETGELMDISAGAAWCLSEYQTLMLAESYLIAAQMNPLIHLAAADIPQDIILEEHMLPSKHGFLVFEDPWDTVDVGRKRLLTRVITWEPMEDQHGALGVQVTEYSAISDGDDISQMILNSARLREHTLDTLGDLQVQHLMALRFGTSILGNVDPTWDDNKIRAAQGPVKAMLALWMLMQQRVTETVVPAISPRTERRWKRKGVKPQVNVINLRRRRIISQTAAEHESGGTREWSGRWMVKGHWRQQPYGPGRQERRWVYIHPFLKGPDDLPIIDKRPKVYKLSH